MTEELDFSFLPDFLRKFFLLHLLLVLTGCGLFTRTKVEYVKVPAPRETCLQRPPEKLHTWTFDAGGEGKCDATYDACFSPVDAAALEINLKILYRGILDDWDRCGPKE